VPIRKASKDTTLLKNFISIIRQTLLEIHLVIHNIKVIHIFCSVYPQNKKNISIIKEKEKPPIFNCGKRFYRLGKHSYALFNFFSY